MVSAKSAGMQRHFWQSSQHTHAARGRCDTDAPSVMQAELLGIPVYITAEFLNKKSLAGLLLPIYKFRISTY
jgi:hypothetical protein